MTMRGGESQLYKERLKLAVQLKKRKIEKRHNKCLEINIKCVSSTETEVLFNIKYNVGISIKNSRLNVELVFKDQGEEESSRLSFKE